MINGLDLYKEEWNIETENAIKPGLDAIGSALEELGNPHRQGRFVHIAGTNGKGSTAALLSAVLRVHGKTVGTFYSPGIIDLHDQIQVDAEPILQKALDRVMGELAGVKTALTDFELLTAAAFLHFRNAAPDIVIIEAGMGGRFDSTNVIDPEIAIIPSISKEHTNFLGDQIEDIAFHKAGIIKKWRPVIAGPIEERAMAVIRQEAKLKHAELLVPACPHEGEMKLKGAHQKWNAQLALEAAKELLQLEFQPQLAQKALSMAELAYRFETAAPGLVFDGAHNEASIDALVETIRSEFPEKHVRIVLGMLSDKAYERVLRQLETVSDDFVFVDFSNARALPAEKLFFASNSKIKTTKNLYDILPVTEKNAVTIVTGSLYLLSAMRKPGIPFLRDYQNVTS
ncbi:Mur ligase family protein [Planococcus sp. ISL-109]|uniref:bifunctional folylpolyglutamate synthase/dihydrofolate synthase n=1 Tax=Planococcus sp. ISL-109 TaxID=2819166 RepID=UPI001BE62766|nr:Mur ligase family protein [Planococcus sp. ISL-109]MBT2582435.1 bifunctional folylpolyglutamate synthase/dihydrofolate synthase [Planococcus sp. ISL-109]